MDSKSVNVEIGPDHPFVHGITLGLHTSIGNDYDNKVSNLSDAYKTSDLTIGVKLVLNNPDQASGAIQMLNTIKEQLTAIPMIEGALQGGCQIEFRTEGLNVFLDLHVSGEFAAMVTSNPLIANLNISAVDFNHKISLEISSGFDPVPLFSKLPEEIFDSMLNWSISGQYNSEKMQNLLDKLEDFLTKQMHVKPKNLATLRIILAITLVQFKFTYVPSTLKELINSLSHGSHLNALTGVQGMAQGNLPMAQEMAPMVISQFVDILKSFMFSDYEVHIYIPKLRFYGNINLSIPSLNQFVHDHFLQS